MTLNKKTISERIIVRAYKSGSTIAGKLSPTLAHKFSSLLGWVLCVAMPRKRKMLERHLRRVDPTITRKKLRVTSRRALASYARYYIESFRLPRLNKEQVDAGIETLGYEHVEAGLAAGRGVILALPHLGGWEWAGRWMTEKNVAMNVVVEPLNPPELFEWFVGLRSKLGMNVMPLSPSIATEVAAALKRNEIVCLLCDRDIQRSGIEVEFFGEKTTLPPGPAMIALRTGAVLLPTVVYFTEHVDGHLGVVRPPLSLERQGGLRSDVARLTQDLAKELEYLITAHPDQWHLLQPNWPSDPGFELPSIK